MAAFITICLTLSLTCAGLGALTQSRFWAWAASMLGIATLVAALGGVL